MTTKNDRAELKFSLKRERVERLLAMLEVKRANGGLNAEETKAHEVATLRLFGAGPHRKSSRALPRNRSMACCGASIASPAPVRLGD